ncbi:hypothetical protein CB7_198 [Pectobacterium phage vB_PatM_CB7]|uniref:Uncharacterized protein n=1 Tax=Pectobacterium phage phiTE TaxID=1116482 RepID=K9L3V2_9CAUD|nr:hypothetical protein phiTE_153 [Pectobacterium phage phiTE]AEZ66319.1 hypothetical protein phiTE_153 [Pectobacterium phage phiTE]ARB11651.1 hypothetical protein CB7_198 [Pectobacterium phage vB_PatM_CB7]
MTVLWWFIYRRWRMISWTKDYDAGMKKDVLNNGYRVNLCSCREHRVIYRDMQRILK